MKDNERDMQLASSGTEEDLKGLVHHHSRKVIERMLLNRNLTEELVLTIANRRNIDADIIESIYMYKKWRESYRIMLALCRNPKTRQKITLSLMKSLRIFDIADLTRNRQIPINVRMKAEAHISEKILPMPLGIKIALARRASANILMRLIEDGMKEVAAVCLESPQMTEGILCKVLSMKKIASHVIRQIAGHPKWSRRYDVQWALIRNNHAPLSRVVHFLGNIKTKDLRELHASPEVPKSTKPFIFRELRDREEINGS
jgi:hypothetical protein